MSAHDAPKYSYFIEWSSRDQEFAASFIELPGLSGVAPNIPDAIFELHRAFDAWLEVVREKGFQLPAPIPHGDSPLVIIDRSHLGDAGALVTGLQSVLPDVRVVDESKNVTTGTSKASLVKIDAPVF
jgi:predicted RNase H-like HicB family nuclease